MVTAVLTSPTIWHEDPINRVEATKPQMVLHPRPATLQGVLIVADIGRLERINSLKTLRFRYGLLAAAAGLWGALLWIASSHFVPGLGPFALSVGLLGNVVVLQMKIHDVR